MNKFYRGIFGMISAMIMMGSGIFLTKADAETVRPEVRAWWVDAFHDGAKNPAQIDKLINDCLTANINTLFVQVRRRGDAYYNKSFEPRTEDPKLPANFDALQYLIEKAHANHIEVHAWLNTLVAWNKETPPRAAEHIWNVHGPQATGEANWVAYYRRRNTDNEQWSEKLYPSYFLDPGNPAALDYTVEVYLNVVRNYDIDGIHLDYSRYDNTSWGFNPTNVARYNARYGATGLPSPDDAQWQQWRREQTANLMRKVYLRAIAIKPMVKVSSAVVTWGEGPVAEGDWEKSKAYTWVAQDWRRWIEEGIVDLAVPMNYYQEWNLKKKEYYKQWIEWEKDHQYGRQIVIGPGLFDQYIEESLEQIRQAQQPSASGNYAAGVALFAYGWNNLYGNDDYIDQPSASKSLPRQPHVYLREANDWMTPLLVREGSYTDPATKKVIVTQPVFKTAVPVPDMPWKSHPTKGFLMGVVDPIAGKKSDGVKITVESLGATEPKIQRVAVADGSGWYGMAELPAGQYRLTIDKADFTGTKQVEVAIQPGVVSEVNFSAVVNATSTILPSAAPTIAPKVTPEATIADPVSTAIPASVTK